MAGSRDSGSEPETYRITLSRGGSVLPKKVAFLAETAQPALMRLTIRIRIATMLDRLPVVNPIFPNDCWVCFDKVRTAIQSSTRLRRGQCVCGIDFSLCIPRIRSQT